MKIKVKDKEFSFDGYVNPINSVQNLAEEIYQQGRADAIEERASLLAFICKKYNIPLVDMNCTVDEWEELKEQKDYG